MNNILLIQNNKKLTITNTLLLVCLMLINFSAFVIEGTFGAWNVTSTIEDNKVSTGVWSEFNTGDVVINEIMWTGSTESVADEWIELRNTTASPIDLTGWTIENLGTDSIPDITIPSGIIEAGGYFLIGNYSVDNSAINDTNIVDYDIITMQLQNAGEKLILKDPGSFVIDETPVGNWAAGDNDTAGEFKSMERNLVPGDGSLSSSWHTCIDVGCTSVTFWDVEGDNYGTPRAENLSLNDPTSPDYIEKDWSYTVAWVEDDNDEMDDSEIVVDKASLSEGSGTTSDSVDILIDSNTSKTDSEEETDSGTGEATTSPDSAVEVLDSLDDDDSPDEDDSESDVSELDESDEEVVVQTEDEVIEKEEIKEEEEIEKEDEKVEEEEEEENDAPTETVTTETI